MKLKTNIVNKHHIQTQAHAQVQWSARAMVKISRKSAVLCELTRKTGLPRPFLIFPSKEPPSSCLVFASLFLCLVHTDVPPIVCKSLRWSHCWSHSTLHPRLDSCSGLSSSRNMHVSFYSKGSPISPAAFSELHKKKQGSSRQHPPPQPSFPLLAHTLEQHSWLSHL